MSLYFISDLHLNPQQPDLIAVATGFIEQLPADTTALYILGDLFNTWLGDDLAPPEFAGFTAAIAALAERGILSYFMVGNRDFMVGKRFAAHAKMMWLAEPALIQLDNVPTLLCHGDSLCTDDVSYQRYRKWTRNRPLQRIFLTFPRALRQRISDKIKQQSQQKKQYKSADIMDVNAAAVVSLMQQHKVQRLIHGHTHRPAIHDLTIANQPAQRIVLGDWQTTPSFLRYAAGEFTLVDPRIKLTPSAKPD